MLEDAACRYLWSVLTSQNMAASIVYESSSGVARATTSAPTVTATTWSPERTPGIRDAGGTLLASYTELLERSRHWRSVAARRAGQ